MQRKKQPKPFLDPVKVNLVLLGLVIISLIILFTINVHGAQHSRDEARSQLVSEQYRARHLKAHGDPVSEGHFDLVRNDQQLQSQYSKLAKQIFGGYRKPSQYSNNRATIVKFFGTTGYQQLKNQIEVNTKGQMQLAPTKNDGVQVAFANYDSVKQTVDVSIYVKYEAGSQHRIDYISTTYSFKQHRANFGTTQMATVGDDQQ